MMGSFDCLPIHNGNLVKDLVNRWHSTLKAPVGWRVAFTLVSGGRIAGISTWGHPTARLEDQVSTLEHTRMALGPGAPKNAGSWFLARNREWIRENMPEICRLIAYVDLMNHNGTIYKADNWRLVYRKLNRTSWKSRPGRTGVPATLRAKYERKP